MYPFLYIKSFHIIWFSNFNFHLFCICQKWLKVTFNYKPHLSSNNYCNSFMILCFLRQQLNLHTVSLSFRHQYPLLVFLLSLTILEGWDYKETVRNLKDVLVILEQLEWLLCIRIERQQIYRNHQIFRGFPNKYQELGGTHVMKEMDWKFWALMKNWKYGV